MPAWLGCFETMRGTCADLCRTESRQCVSAGCDGLAYQIYTLVGPCTRDQVTRFTGTSCTDVLDIGTSGLLYVQCCCQ